MSVHQLPDGRWICKFPAGTIPGQPRKNKEYFGRGPDAERAAWQRNDELGLGAARGKPAAPIFFDLTRQYLDARRNAITKSTYESLILKLTRVILPALGELQVHEITPAVLDRYVAERHAGGVKLRTVRDDLAYIRAVLNFALQRGLIVHNPLVGYAPPRNDAERIRPPSDAEFAAILDKAAPHVRRALLLFAFTGIRPGPREAFGLTWDQVDFHGRTITVVSAEKGGLPVREIPLAAVLLEHLREWQAEDAEHGRRWIINYHGARVDSIKTGWQAAKRRAGITRRLRLYDLRHAAATKMLARGADLKTVARILGHKSPVTTMTVYQHVSDEQTRAAIDKL